MPLNTRASMKGTATMAAHGAVDVVKAAGRGFKGGLKFIKDIPSDIGILWTSIWLFIWLAILGRLIKGERSLKPNAHWVWAWWMFIILIGIYVIIHLTFLLFEDDFLVYLAVSGIGFLLGWYYTKLKKMYNDGSKDVADVETSSWVPFIGGIVSLIIGIILKNRPEKIVGLVLIIIGIWLILYAILKKTCGKNDKINFIGAGWGKCLKNALTISLYFIVPVLSLVIMYYIRDNIECATNPDMSFHIEMYIYTFILIAYIAGIIYFTGDTIQGDYSEVKGEYKKLTTKN